MRRVPNIEVSLRTVIDKLEDMKDAYLDRLNDAQELAALADEGPERDRMKARATRALGCVESLTSAIRAFESQLPQGGEAA